MAKQVIIIADTDEKFVASLELKFIEELDENIELEIITDRDYFNEYFLSPKSAQAIVVDEDLYTPELKRHNVNKIFVLSESNDDGGTEDLEIEKIFKYSSPKEIYKQVISQGNIGTSNSSEKETVVALVYSACGGVGKSTVALGVSEALAKSFNKVLYINAQRINSFQHMLMNQATIPNNSVSDFSDSSSNVYGRISHIIRNESFDYLPPFGMAIASLGMDFSLYADIIKSAKASKKYDVIVVDTDTTFDEAKADLITLADKVLIVLEQDKRSVFATGVLLKNISCNDSAKYFFVCNKFDDEKSNAITSGEIEHSFIINEYIKEFDNYDSMSLSDISNQPDVQKVSYLII